MTIYDRPLDRGALGPLADPDARHSGAASTRAARAVSRPQGGESVRSGSFRPAAFAPLIDRAARAHDIDPLLLHAIARVESRHQPNAVSHAGAHGLMQVIVPTARRFGVGAAQQLRDPETNLDVSARYLKTLQQRFGNDLPLVLAAYNAGEGAVEKYGRKIPPYRETQGYVRKVIAEYDLLRRVSTGHRSATVLSRVAAESDL
ncbi:lytic transglycosylase domain-containing protein [Ottowia sp. GY511]|nr:lytic transglycosylase domain-containing protein [Ottowia sp. GY511]